jgi:nitronate monooxygenase
MTPSLADLLPRPLRAAAAASGDPERMSLWAGQGYRSATALPAGEIIERLSADRGRP